MKDNWEHKKLGEVLIFDKRFNGIPKEEQPKITQFTHVSAEVLKQLRTEKGEVKLLSTGLFSAYTTAELAKDYINEGEVVTIPTGGVANIKYYKGKFVDSGNILGVSSGPDVLLKFVYMGMIANKELINSYFRGVSIKHPYMPDIYNIIIPVPPISMQQQIVEELDLLSSIIEKKKEQLKELDNLAQSIFYDMFGDPILNDKGWKLMTIQNIVAKDKNSIKRGPFGGALKKEIFVEKGYLVYEQYHALNNDYTYGRYFITEEKYKEMIDFAVKEGDIIISCSGVNLGKLSIIPSGAKEGIINQALLKLTLNKNIFSNIFFLYIFQEKNFKEKYFGDNRGCAIPNMPPMMEFKKIQFICPPISLQQQFASKIEAIEQQKELIKQSLVETQTMFDYTMDKYFG